MNAQQNSPCVNGVDTAVLGKTVGAIKEDPGLGACKFRVHNTWAGSTRNSSSVLDFYGAKQEMKHTRTFVMNADEPPMLAGQDSGANPVEYLLHALASCMTTSMVAHAAVRGIRIEELSSELEGDIDLRGFLGLSAGVPKGFTNIRVTFAVKCAAEDMKKLRSLAEFSPVYSTLTSGTKVDFDIVAK